MTRRIPHPTDEFKRLPSHRRKRLVTPRRAPTLPQAPGTQEYVARYKDKFTGHHDPYKRPIGNEYSQHQGWHNRGGGVGRSDNVHCNNMEPYGRPFPTRDNTIRMQEPIRQAYPPVVPSNHSRFHCTGYRENERVQPIEYAGQGRNPREIAQSHIQYIHPPHEDAISRNPPVVSLYNPRPPEHVLPVPPTIDPAEQLKITNPGGKVNDGAKNLNWLAELSKEERKQLLQTLMRMNEVEEDKDPPVTPKNTEVVIPVTFNASSPQKRPKSTDTPRRARNEKSIVVDQGSKRSRCRDITEPIVSKEGLIQMFQDYIAGHRNRALKLMLNSCLDKYSGIDSAHVRHGYTVSLMKLCRANSEALIGISDPKHDKVDKNILPYIINALQLESVLQKSPDMHKAESPRSRRLVMMIYEYQNALSSHKKYHLSPSEGDLNDKRQLCIIQDHITKTIETWDDYDCAAMRNQIDVMNMINIEFVKQSMMHSHLANGLRNLEKITKEVDVENKYKRRIDKAYCSASSHFEKSIERLIADMNRSHCDF